MPPARMSLPRPILPRLALALLLAAPGPGFAQSKEIERYDCAVLQACDPGQPCRTDDGTVMDLVFEGQDLTVTYGGQPVAARFDPQFRSAVWELGDVVMQMRFVGDGSGVILISPAMGDVWLSQVQIFHCSPA